MNKYMLIALKEAEKAYKNGDVPVGAVIVKNNKVIAKAHNCKESHKIATNHAEILVINKACKKLKTWYLDDCTLYTTMEPCMMCCGAIMQSRIKKIVYSVNNPKYGCSSLLKSTEIVCNVYKNESEILLKRFFSEIR